MKKINKVVLAYSGGLDTSVIMSWLIENYVCEVIAVSADVGQEDELDGLVEKAKNSGASKCLIEDLTQEFVEEFILKTLKAGAKYEGDYLLGTAFARPIIAKKLVEIAHKENADAIVHGCTGKGNDQIRFETAIRHFDPDIEIIAPWRIWDIKSREDALEYAKSRNIPIKSNKGSVYSEDRNIWHISHEGLDLENPANEANLEKVLTLSKSPFKAPDKATSLEIQFEKGIPVSINGENLSPIEIIKKLNKIGGDNAIGIDDIIENRLIGMKVRGIYENPAGAILYKAHKILENLVLDKETSHYKELISIKFGQLVYNGLWFTTLREALSEFVDKTQERVTGTVKLNLYKGNIINAGVTSKYSLFNESYATFSADEVYNQYDSQGYVNLYALPTRVEALMKKKVLGDL
ncbi:MAG: argininosuccinate synthase [Peptoniphilaceae bacterium]